jgi:hypothetical protein
VAAPACADKRGGRTSTPLPGTAAAQVSDPWCSGGVVVVVQVRCFTCRLCLCACFQLAQQSSCRLLCSASGTHGMGLR